MTKFGIAFALGTDGSDAFLEVHGGDKRVIRVLDSLQVGELVDQQGLLETPAEVMMLVADFLKLSNVRAARCQIAEHAHGPVIWNSSDE